MSTLVEKVRKQLKDDYCHPGVSNVRIPPERALVKRFSVSRETVRKAMSELVRDGHVKRYRGKGTFVANPDGDDRPPRLRSVTVGLIARRLTSLEASQWVTCSIDTLHDQNAAALTNMSHSDPFRELELLQAMVQRQVDGILLQPCTPTSESPTLNRQLAAMDLGRSTPMVVLGQVTACPHATTVWFDEAAAGEAATNHLIKLGRRRIAHVGFKQGSSLWQRTAGYQRAMQAAGLAINPAHQIDVATVPHSDQSLEMGRNAARILFSTDQPPDAVFCYWDEMAAGVIIEAVSRGIRVPQDLAVIGIAHMSAETQAKVPMAVSSVWYDLPAMASRAADQLLRQVDGQQGGQTITLDFDLRPAASTIGG